jgi:MOSC domain-containing protein YiiM
MTGRVIAVHASAEHTFSKARQGMIRLLAGLGVDGDAHSGATMRHRGRLPRDADRPNLRQVHLIHVELLAELRGKGFDIEPGQMGENITTSGLHLLSLPKGTCLRIGDEAVVELTGLRNPCKQLDGLAPGLMQATLDYAETGKLIRLAGVMGVVLTAGEVRAGDEIRVQLPKNGRPLEPV